MDWRAYLRHLDYILIAATLGLIAYGVTMIYFATRHDIDGRPLYFVTQQLVAVVVGVVAAAVVSLLDYEIYRRFQWLMYAFAVFILRSCCPSARWCTAPGAGSISASRASSPRRSPSCCLP